MTSIVKTSRGKGGWLVALVVATIFAQSVLAQAPGTAAAPAQPAAAAVEPAPAPAAPEPAPTELMHEQDKTMINQFLLAIAVFFAVIAFLLLVSLPPRNAGDQN